MFCWCTCVNTLPHFVNQRLRCGIPCILSSVARPYAYRQVCNIRRTLVGNKIVDHSDVVGASPVGAAPTTDWVPGFNRLRKDNCKTRGKKKFCDLMWFILEIWWYLWFISANQWTRWLMDIQMIISSSYFFQRRLPWHSSFRKQGKHIQTEFPLSTWSVLGGKKFRVSTSLTMSIVLAERKLKRDYFFKPFIQLYFKLMLRPFDSKCLNVCFWRSHWRQVDIGIFNGSTLWGKNTFREPKSTTPHVLSCHNQFVRRGYFLWQWTVDKLRGTIKWNWSHQYIYLWINLDRKEVIVLFNWGAWFQTV